MSSERKTGAASAPRRNRAAVARISPKGGRPAPRATKTAATTQTPPCSSAAAMNRLRLWSNCASRPKASPASSSSASNRKRKPSVLPAGWKEAPNRAICRSELFEKSGSLRRGVAAIVAALRVLAAQQLGCEQGQGGLVVDIVPLGQCSDRQTDFTRSHERLTVDALGAPVDRLEQALVKMLQPDQVIAAIRRRTEDDPIARLPEAAHRFAQ